MPLISVAIESGISIRFGLSPTLLAIVRTTGINIATIADELINAPMVPASIMTNVTRRASLLPPAFMTASPRRYATPVAIKPSPTIDTAAIRITTGWPKPATASWIVSTPLKFSARTTRIATTSGRIRPDANSTTAPARIPKTISMCAVMAPISLVERR